MSAFVRNEESFECPHCGADVPVGAKVCRSCGASDDCGWNDIEDDSDWSDDDDFDYDRFISREFPESQDPAVAVRQNLFLKIMVLAIIASLFIWLLGG